MSIIDNFMSRVVDLDEKEKEETVLFLAEALANDNFEFLKSISPKVQNIVLPFLSDLAVKANEKMIKERGGEKDGSIGTGKKFKEN